MNGSYGLHSERVNFVGDVQLEAKVSQTMSGVKHWMLIPFDPLFMKHGAGTYLPVMSGERDSIRKSITAEKDFLGKSLILSHDILAPAIEANKPFCHPNRSGGICGLCVPANTGVRPQRCFDSGVQKRRTLALRMTNQESYDIRIACSVRYVLCSAFPLPPRPDQNFAAE